MDLKKITQFKLGDGRILSCETKETVTHKIYLCETRQDAGELNCTLSLLGNRCVADFSKNWGWHVKVSK